MSIEKIKWMAPYRVITDINKRTHLHCAPLLCIHIIHTSIQQRSIPLHSAKFEFVIYYLNYVRVFIANCIGILRFLSAILFFSSHYHVNVSKSRYFFHECAQNFLYDNSPSVQLCIMQTGKLYLFPGRRNMVTTYKNAKHNSEIPCDTFLMLTENTLTI